MTKPRHGKLHLDFDEQWVFCYGTSTTIINGMKLLDFMVNCQNLMDTSQLFCGHEKFHRVYQARKQVQLRDCMLHHVSAHGLTSLTTLSTLKQHHNVISEDKNIWDPAYNKEFDGLNNLPTWDIISEE